MNEMEKEYYDRFEIKLQDFVLLISSSTVSSLHRKTLTDTGTCWVPNIWPMP